MIPLIFAIDFSSLQYVQIGFTPKHGLQGCLYSEPYLANPTSLKSHMSFVGNGVVERGAMSGEYRRSTMLNAEHGRPLDKGCADPLIV